jgi:hypothetical protein
MSANPDQKPARGPNQREPAAHVARPRAIEDSAMGSRSVKAVTSPPGSDARHATQYIIGG